jgi:hypothetical protein
MLLHANKIIQKNILTTPEQASTIDGPKEMLLSHRNFLRFKDVQRVRGKVIQLNVRNTRLQRTHQTLQASAHRQLNMKPYPFLDQFTIYIFLLYTAKSAL